MTANGNRSNAGVISIVVLSLITLGLFAMSAYLFWIDQRVFLTGDQGQATIINKREVSTPNRTGPSTRSYYVRYRFVPNGQSVVTGKQPVSAGFYDRIKVGEKTPVWFDAAAPNISYVDRIARWNALICLAIALLFAAGTFYCIRYEQSSPETGSGL